MPQHPSCSICNNVIPPSPEGSVGLGYAFLPNSSAVICYPCCAERDKQQMRDTGKITLYLTCDPATKSINPWGGREFRSSLGHVTNWPGSLRIACHTRQGKHNIARTRYDVWFKFEGYEWWGVSYGENTQLVHCKRTKQKV